MTSLNLTISSGQVVAVTLSGYAEAQVLGMIAAEYTTAVAREEVLMRTYHLGGVSTTGINYDDRLTTRIKCSRTTAYKYLSLPVKRGGIRNRRIGKKYLVTEQAVREWLGDSINT